MPSVRSSLVIAAPPARVWAVLTDFARYPEWNPVIPTIRAEARVGASARFRIEGTRLTHGEDFTGLLDLVVRGAVHGRVTRTYDRLNAALKARAEA